jgi:hypothetical protein
MYELTSKAAEPPLIGMLHAKTTKFVAAPATEMVALFLAA